MGTQQDVKDRLRQGVESAKDAEQRAADGKPKKQGEMTVRELFEDPTTKTEIAKALPKAVTPERFARIGLTAINSSPRLLECRPLTLLAAFMQCAQLGLEPNTPLQHCWLVPYWNSRENCREVQFQLGYAGIVDLALRGGRVLSIKCRTVYDNEKFVYKDGLDDILEHEPLPPSERGEPRAYYIVARLPGGGHYWRVVWPEDVEAHRAKSQSPDSKAWTENYEAMAHKTCVQMSKRYLPLSPEAAAAIEADESTPTWEQFTEPGVGGSFIDVPSSEADDVDDNHCTECKQPLDEHTEGCSQAPL